MIGGTVLAALEHEGVPALRTREELRRWLDARLTRPHDRAVFDLATRQVRLTGRAQTAADLPPRLAIRRLWPARAAAAESAHCGAGHRRTLAFLRNALRAPVACVRCRRWTTSTIAAFRAAAAPRGSGGCFHLSFRSGSRGGGASGARGFDYITRERRVRRSRSRRGHLHRVRSHAVVGARTIPRVLGCGGPLRARQRPPLCQCRFRAAARPEPDDQIELARQFAQELTEEEQLPYTLAIHERPRRGRTRTQPARASDVLRAAERRHRASREQWFRRANSEHPERGGAPKSRTFHGRDWVEQARERWAEMTNETLERAGGPSASIIAATNARASTENRASTTGRPRRTSSGRGDDHERLDDAARRRRSRRKRFATIDKEIARLEATRDAIVRDGLPERNGKPEPRDYSHSHFGRRSRRESWGR